MTKDKSKRKRAGKKSSVHTKLVFFLINVSSDIFSLKLKGSRITP
jgi:hypothetical protein